MDAEFVCVLVQMTRPSPFSKVNQYVFRAEEVAQRQFTLAEQQDEVSEPSFVRLMKIWMMTKRNFLNELQENFKLIRDELIWTELDWTTVRNLCAPLTEEDLVDKQEREKELSELYNSKVSLGGFYMLVSSFNSEAQKDVQSFLQSLHKQLLRVFLCVTIPGGPLPAGDAMEEKLLQLEQFAAPAVPQVVQAALMLLLEEEEQGEQEEAASTEIGQLLVESMAPYFFSPDVTENDVFLQGICSAVALLVFRAIRKRFQKYWEFFQETEYECCFSAFVEMTHRRQTDSPSQAPDLLSSSEAQTRVSFQEEREASLEEQEDQQGLTEEREDFVRREDFPQSTMSNQASFEDSFSEAAENQPVEEMGASPHVTATEELEEILLEKREASLEVTAPATPKNVSEDTSEVDVDKNISVDNEQETPQQEKVDSSETQESLPEDCQRQKRRKKKGVKAFFCGVWKSLTSCCCSSTDE